MLDGYTLVSSDSHVLNSTYLTSFKDDSAREYPSVEHYCQYQILLRLGMLSDAKEVLTCRTAQAARRMAWRCIRDKFEGDSLTHLCNTVEVLKETNLTKALAFRFDQDMAFRRALMQTESSLITICESTDRIWGIGMSEETFKLTVGVHSLKPNVIVRWMSDPSQAHEDVEMGSNKLGLLLMRLRSVKQNSAQEQPSAQAASAAEVFKTLQSDWHSASRRMSHSPDIAVGSPEPPVGPVPVPGPSSVTGGHAGTAGTDLSSWEERAMATLDYSVDQSNGGHLRSNQFNTAPRRGRSPPLAERSLDRYGEQMRPVGNGGSWDTYRGVPKIVHVPTEDDRHKQIRSELVSRLGFDVSNEIVLLEGLFRYLSNFHPSCVLVDGETYLSVEHYVYYNFLVDLNLPVQARYVKNEVAEPRKIYEIVYPFAVKIAAANPGVFRPAKHAFDRSYFIAMRAKFEQNSVLQTVLLSTGDSLLVEHDCPENPDYSAGVAAEELRHLVFNKGYTTREIAKIFVDEPASRPPECEHWGMNRTGILLMELRHAIRASYSGPLPEPIVKVPRVIATANVNPDQITCFSPNSLLGPQYLCSFRMRSKVYLTVEQYVCVSGLRFLRFPKTAESYLISQPVGQCTLNILHMIDTQPPPIGRVWEWTRAERLEAIKMGYRTMFEQSPAALRALLQTGNQLMVYCAPYRCILDVELSTGMSEADFGMYIQEYNYVAADIMRFSVHRKARPPLFGGNRLGLLLMELRKEFSDQGYYLDARGTIQHASARKQAAPAFSVYEDDAEMTSAHAKRRRLEKATEVAKSVVRKSTQEQNRSLGGGGAKGNADQLAEAGPESLPPECERMSLNELKSYAGRLIEVVHCLERITTIQSEKRETIRKQLKFVQKHGKTPPGYAKSKKPAEKEHPQAAEPPTGGQRSSSPPTTLQLSVANMKLTAESEKDMIVQLSPAPEDPKPGSETPALVTATAASTSDAQQQQPSEAVSSDHRSDNEDQHQRVEPPPSQCNDGASSCEQQRGTPDGQRSIDLKNGDADDSGSERNPTNDDGSGLKRTKTHSDADGSTTGANGSSGGKVVDLDANEEGGLGMNEGGNENDD